MCSEIPDELRPYLIKLNRGLGEKANTLWGLAKGVHEHQTQKSDPTEHGHLHVRAVEYNIWRFLNLSHDKKGDKNLNKLEAHELFLLSGAACCHDFDKAGQEDGYQHGEGSASFLKRKATTFGLREVEADAIADVISVHDRKGEEFGQKLKGVEIQRDSLWGRFDLQLLILLLKVGDILHTDASRVNELLWNDTIGGKVGSKCRARLSILGWHIEGPSVVLSANPESQENRQALETYLGLMKAGEWEPISKLLKDYQFPHKLACPAVERTGGHTPIVPGGYVPPGPDPAEDVDAKVERVKKIAQLLRDAKGSEGKDTCDSEAEKTRHLELAENSVGLSEAIRDYDYEIDFRINVSESLEKVETQADMVMRNHGGDTAFLRQAIHDLLYLFGVKPELCDGNWVESQDKDNIQKIIQSAQATLSGRVIRHIDQDALNGLLREVVSFQVGRNVPLYGGSGGKYKADLNVIIIKGKSQALSGHILSCLRSIAETQYKGIKAELEKLPLRQQAGGKIPMKEYKPAKADSAVVREAAK